MTLLIKSLIVIYIYFLCLFLVSKAQERCKAPFEHQCKNDGRCILAQDACDGIRHCFDGSDETSNLCRERPCSQTREHIQKDPLSVLTIGRIGSSHTFRCNYGACLPNDLLCNGVDNCHDFSDENVEECKDKICKSNQFKCDYGGCIDAISVCNGAQDCFDGSDETVENCKIYRHYCLTSTHFRCDYGGCIQKYAKCDGIADCWDLSDENSCGHENPPKPYITLRGKKEKEEVPIDEGVTIETPQADSTFIGPGCQQKTANGEKIELNYCGLEDRICLGSGLLPYDTVIGVTCKGKVDSEGFVLECRKDGMWHYLDYEGVLPPVTIICQGEAISTPTGCVGDSSSNDAIRVLQCGRGGVCDGIMNIYPPGTFVFSPCSPSGGKGAVLECREDAFWHRPQEEAPPFYALCDAGHISKKGCSTDASHAIDLEILTCGGDANDCGTLTTVPQGTIAFAICKGIPKAFILQCNSDGDWHQLGGDPGPQMTLACQYQEIPKIQESCGSRTEKDVDFNWTFLVGLFRGGKFACTGTLISASLVVTGGHCVVRSQDTSDLITADELMIQHAIPGGRSAMVRAASIRLYPRYSGGDKPSFDLALVRLKRSALRGTMQPACLDTGGRFLGKRSIAFNRTEGDEHYSWSPFPISLDVSCFNKGSICSRHLRVDKFQFCGANEESSAFLHPGSSGGPYLINLGTTRDERWAVAGIVSHKVQTEDDAAFCSRPHTVFLSAHKFHRWIFRCGLQDRCQLLS